MALNLTVRSSLNEFLWETHGSMKSVESSVLADHFNENPPLTPCHYFQDVQLSVLSVGSLVRFVTDLACRCYSQYCTNSINSAVTGHRALCVDEKSQVSPQKHQKIFKISGFWEIFAYKWCLLLPNMVIWRNQNFVRLVTGHTPWRIDWISTVLLRPTSQRALICCLLLSFIRTQFGKNYRREVTTV